MINSKNSLILEMKLNTHKKIKKNRMETCLFRVFYFALGILCSYSFNIIKHNIKKTEKENKINPMNFSLKNFEKFENKSIIKNENILFLNTIDKIFNENHKVNINNVEKNISTYKQNIFEYIKSTIHIAFTLDPNYVLETMLTLSSIMDTQNKNTKIVFHFGVIKDFTAKKMLKIYQLKERINNLTEFNFYYLADAMNKMKNFHPKGEACPGKFELIKLLPDDVERILLFDAGDVLVLRDLTELYNYNMEDYWVLGLPEPWCIDAFLKSYDIKKYLNIGSILINVKEFKTNNFWEKYIEKRYLKLGGSVDQTLFNIVVPDNKKGYFPFRLGGYPMFCNDKDSDNFKFHDFGLEPWLRSELSNSLPEKPESMFKLISQIYNSHFIHQFCGKWYYGQGLSIYRNLAKYYIKLAGIWEDICKKRNGYCK